MTTAHSHQCSSGRGRVDHLSALAYKDGRLIGIELDHEDFPSTARDWKARGLTVEIVSEREALARWDRDVRRVGPEHTERCP